MPATLSCALNFLETQWSHVNENKIKGILAELSLRDFLESQDIDYISGGWIVTPGNNTVTPEPTMNRICLIPVSQPFSVCHG